MPTPERVRVASANQKERAAHKGWQAKFGLMALVSSAAKKEYEPIVDKVIARSTGKTLQFSQNKKALYYPPTVLIEIYEEVLKLELPTDVRLNVQKAIAATRRLYSIPAQEDATQ